MNFERIRGVLTLAVQVMCNPLLHSAWHCNARDIAYMQSVYNHKPTKRLHSLV